MKEYLKAVHLLTMSEAEQAKMELTEKEDEWDWESRELKLELLLQKEMNRDYGVRLAALEERMRGILPGQAPAAAQPAPRSRPQAGT